MNLHDPAVLYAIGIILLCLTILAIGDDDGSESP